MPCPGINGVLANGCFLGIPAGNKIGLQLPRPSGKDTLGSLDPLLHQQRGVFRLTKRNLFPLILASSSPRRRELLTAIGVPFRVIPSEIPENVSPGEDPISHVKRLSRAKAEHVGKKYPGTWILGADTIVVIDGIVLGKPSDAQEAAGMLSRLAGRRHEVFTGYSILNSDRPEQELLRCVRSVVTIRRMTEREIKAYIETGEPMDKAGSYAIQGVGSAIVKRVQGSYTNVVGLPLCEVARDLQQLEVFNFLEFEG